MSPVTDHKALNEVAAIRFEGSGASLFPGDVTDEEADAIVEQLLSGPIERVGSSWLDERERNRVGTSASRRDSSSSSRSRAQCTTPVSDNNHTSDHDTTSGESPV